MSRVTVSAPEGAPRQTEVCVDGVPITGLRRFKIEQVAGEAFPVLTVEVFLMPGAVSLPDAVVKALAVDPLAAVDAIGPHEPFSVARDRNKIRAAEERPRGAMGDHRDGLLVDEYGRAPRFDEHDRLLDLAIRGDASYRESPPGLAEKYMALPTSVRLSILRSLGVLSAKRAVRAAHDESYLLAIDGSAYALARTGGVATADRFVGLVEVASSAIDWDAKIREGGPGAPTACESRYDTATGRYVRHVTLPDGTQITQERQATEQAIAFGDWKTIAAETVNLANGLAAALRRDVGDELLVDTPNYRLVKPVDGATYEQAERIVDGIRITERRTVASPNAVTVEPWVEISRETLDLGEGAEA